MTQIRCLVSTQGLKTFSNSRKFSAIVPWNITPASSVALSLSRTPIRCRIIGCYVLAQVSECAQCRLRPLPTRPVNFSFCFSQVTFFFTQEPRQEAYFHVTCQLSWAEIFRYSRRKRKTPSQLWTLCCKLRSIFLLCLETRFLDSDLNFSVPRAQVRSRQPCGSLQLLFFLTTMSLCPFLLLAPEDFP